MLPNESSPRQNSSTVPDFADEIDSDVQLAVPLAEFLSDSLGTFMDTPADLGIERLLGNQAVDYGPQIGLGFGSASGVNAFGAHIGDCPAGHATKSHVGVGALRVLTNGAVCDDPRSLSQLASAEL